MTHSEKIRLLDLSLPWDEEATAAHPLYRGLDVKLEAGKPALKTPPEDAVAVLGRNLHALASDPGFDTEEVTITGGMAIWAYLVVFHFLHGKTRTIWYQDGKGQRILVAAHG